MLAQNATSSSILSPTKAQDSMDREVDKIKEKVAEKVSEMKKNNEKAVSGVVESIKVKTIKIKSINENTESEILIDDTLTKLYKVQGATLKNIQQDDIVKGDYLFAIGPEINGVINANGIYLDQRFDIMLGKITEVNSGDFTIKILTTDKKNVILDFQNRTVSEMLDIKTLELSKIGFSKLKEGDSVQVVVKSNGLNLKQTRFDAEKILIIPNEYFLQ